MLAAASRWRGGSCGKHYYYAAWGNATETRGTPHLHP